MIQNSKFPRILGESFEALCSRIPTWNFQLGESQFEFEKQRKWPILLENYNAVKHQAEFCGNDTQSWH